MNLYDLPLVILTASGASYVILDPTACLSNGHVIGKHLVSGREYRFRILAEDHHWTLKPDLLKVNSNLICN